jgi:hypothetical protein
LIIFTEIKTIVTNIDAYEQGQVRWIEKHADYLASDKCLWLLRFWANDIDEVLLPEASQSDLDHVNFLTGRLEDMRSDIKLLDEGMRHLPKKLVETYRANGELTESEQIELVRVGNLIDRLRDYGVIARDEIEQTLNDELYEEFTYEEQRRQAMTERGIKALVRFGREMIKQQKGS